MAPFSPDLVLVISPQTNWPLPFRALDVLDEDSGLAHHTLVLLDQRGKVKYRETAGEGEAVSTVTTQPVFLSKTNVILKDITDNIGDMIDLEGGKVKCT